MGIGSARGENRAVSAAQQAIASPLLEASMDGAHGVILSMCGGSDLGLFEVNEAATIISDAAHPDANIIFGAVIDDALGDEVRITVIAAGFDEVKTQNQSTTHARTATSGPATIAAASAAPQNGSHTLPASAAASRPAAPGRPAQRSARPLRRPHRPGSRYRPLGRAKRPRLAGPCRWTSSTTGWTSRTS